MHENLQKILVSLNEAEAETAIDQAFILKVGCFRVLPYDEGAIHSAQFPISHLEELSTKYLPLQTEPKTNPTALFSQSVIDALNAHPNLFDITTYETEDDHSLTYMWNGARNPGLYEHFPYSLKVNLPARMHTPLFGAERATEQFEVVSNGSIFFSFAPIEDWPELASFGQVFRDLFKEQIESKTELKIPTIGPSPIHPDIYVITKSPASQLHRGPKIYSEGGDVFVVFDRPSAEPLEIALEILKYTSHYFLDFYSKILSRDLLSCYQTEVESLLEEVADAAENLANTSRWALRTHAEYTQIAKANLSMIHLRLVEFQKSVGSHQRAQTEMLKRIYDRQIVSQMSTYFQDHCTYEPVAGNAIQTALTYFQTEIQSQESTRSIVLAALGAAVLGSLIGVGLTSVLS